MPKLIRITTVPMALRFLLPGQMKYIKEQGFEVIMISADGKEREEVIRQEGCEHRIVPMTRKITPFSDLRSLWTLYRLFRKEKPDIIHSHTPKAGLLAMMAGKMAGVKIRIHTVAGLRFMTSSGLTRRILVQMEKITTASATHVWPNSRSLMDYILKNKLASSHKLSLVGFGSSNGINLQRYAETALDPLKLEETRKQLNYTAQLVYLLSVGRIVKDKGIEELLLAFAKISKQRNDLRLVLLGSFEDELDPISEEARRLLKDHPYVIHINWTNNVEYFMHLASILVHPSYREGFPNVLLQAGAMNCPILCSRIEGNIDIVEDGQTGLLFEAGDAASLENKLRWALEHPNHLKEYAAGLRQKIVQRFDQRFVHESLKNKYLELLSEQSSS
ncbi:MAG TPA: glycosyltransferase family 4 protein [Chitinophagaceae bacterium]|nr:glycosyltransferase family 4 protein [Chitinophagaceae bacterium]